MTCLMGVVVCARSAEWFAAQTLAGAASARLHARAIAAVKRACFEIMKFP
jgi:hypothetical protein